MDRSRAKKNILILGAGPAGLACGLEFASKGHKVLIFEKDKVVGGLSKTVNYKNYRFDIGGHRFFSRNLEVNQLWQDILGDKFQKTPRLSRIFYKKKLFKYPIEISDSLIKMGFLQSIRCAVSFLQYKIMPIKPEKSFTDWVTNRFGKELFNIFFKTYTEKVWGIKTEKLSAEWAVQRIRGLTLWGAFRNALFPKTEKVKTLIDEFDYPIFGPGMMYEAIAKKIERGGGKILTDHNILKIERKGNKIAGIWASNNGKAKRYSGDHIISTIPLSEVANSIIKNPTALKNIRKSLKFRDFISVNLIINNDNVFPDNWIYVHDPTVRLGRIQNFKNWSKLMTPDVNHTPIGCEYFCNKGDKLWSTPDDKLVELAKSELTILGLVREEQVVGGFVYRVPNAYPIYQGKYKEMVDFLKKELKLIKNFTVIGRGGMFKYNNMDHSILSGLYAARNILEENKFDLWEINTDDEYCEG